MSETYELLKRDWHRELSVDEAHDEITDKYDKAADKVIELQLTHSHLHLLAEAVLETHNKPTEYGPWAGNDDMEPCQCPACKVAREVMGCKHIQ